LQVFVESLPKIVSLYLGDKLLPARIDSGFNFLSEDRLSLTTQFTFASVTDDLFDQFTKHVVESQAPAGLIISWGRSPFRLNLIPAGDNHWVPVASWGRQQIDAIVELNANDLHEIIKYKSYIPKQGSANLGAGSAVWSDIVQFKTLGIQIGKRLRMNPSDVRKQIIDDVDGCFKRAGSAGRTYSGKVGADGWYHFSNSPNPSLSVEFAERAQLQVSNLPASSNVYDSSSLKVAMGINMVSSCRISAGGPYDDDSIIAYELTGGRYQQYDTRAVDLVINQLAPAARVAFTQFSQLDYADGRTFQVYGR
jgi:hypothetical protein